MGWGIEFTGDIFLNRVTIQNEWQLEDEIESTKQDITNIERILFGLACSSINRSPEEEAIDVIHDIDRGFIDYMEMYREATIQLYKLNLFKDYVKENGFDYGQDNE